MITFPLKSNHRPAPSDRFDYPKCIYKDLSHFSQETVFGRSRKSTFQRRDCWCLPVTSEIRTAVISTPSWDKLVVWVWVYILIAVSFFPEREVTTRERMTSTAKGLKSYDWISTLRWSVPVWGWQAETIYSHFSFSFIIFGTQLTPRSFSTPSWDQVSACVWDIFEWYWRFWVFKFASICYGTVRLGSGFSGGVLIDFWFWWFTFFCRLNNNKRGETRGPVAAFFGGGGGGNRTTHCTLCDGNVLGNQITHGNQRGNVSC